MPRPEQLKNKTMSLLEGRVCGMNGCTALPTAGDSPLSVQGQTTVTSGSTVAGNWVVGSVTAATEDM